MMTILINTKRTAKNTTITERQIDMLNASISRVAELAGQFEAVKSLAINDSDLNLKAFEEYSAYDYGVISKLLAKWINFMNLGRRFKKIRSD